jgi:hypothetical protein
MKDQFKEITKNNGLKQVEWGSEEFIEKLGHVEQQRIEQERDHLEYCVAMIKGM